MKEPTELDELKYNVAIEVGIVFKHAKLGTDYTVNCTNTIVSLAENYAKTLINKSYISRKAVEEAIGEDDRDYSKDNADEESLKILVACSTACNELRADIKKRLLEE